jgi:hypothetical protein
MADAVFVVDDGMDIITNRIKGSGTEPKYLGIGTGATGAAADDTGLETASAEARTSGTTTQVTTTVTNDTYQVVAAVTSLSTQTVTEIALYDASTSGNCFLHGTFSGIPLNADDAVQFTVKVKFDQSA